MFFTGKYAKCNKKVWQMCNSPVQILKLGRKCLSWSFKLLLPIPMEAAILKVTQTY
jgi:hypothetical protein